MKSSRVASGSGTAVMTYCATTASKTESANARLLASITASVSTLLRPSARTRLCALRSIGSEISTPHNFVCGQKSGKRESGPAPAVKYPPADLVGFRNGRLTAVVENLAEHQIVHRRPAPICLCDPCAVDICSHAPALKLLSAHCLGERRRPRRAFS